MKKRKRVLIELNYDSPLGEIYVEETVRQMLQEHGAKLYEGDSSWEVVGASDNFLREMKSLDLIDFQYVNS